MKFIGHSDRFAFEIGDYDDSNPNLRHVDIWAGGVRLCTDDNSVYLGQFIHDLAEEIKGSYLIGDFANYLGGLSTVEMARFVSGTREEDSADYDVGEDRIYLHYQFLDLGPTTDNFSAFLFRDSNKAFFVYSFWRESSVEKEHDAFQVVVLDFDEIISVCRDAMNTLLDT